MRTMDIGTHVGGGCLAVFIGSPAHELTAVLLMGFTAVSFTIRGTVLSVRFHVATDAGRYFRAAFIGPSADHYPPP